MAVGRDRPRALDNRAEAKVHSKVVNADANGGSRSTLPGRRLSARQRFTFANKQTGEVRFGRAALEIGASDVTTRDFMTGVAASQGLYFLIFGVWPVIHMRSFLLVTGPKIDLWLVKTTGLLIASIGFALLMAAWSEDIDQTAVTLSIASAAVLAAVDVIYVYKGVLAPIYLADAAVEVGLLVWGMSALAAR